MADRTLSVKLLADIQGYVRGMDEVARKTRETTTQVEQRLAQQRQAFEQVGAAGLAVGALAAAGVTAAVVAFANFDQAMSNVQAATLESTENMQLLRDAALDAGARTVFSATEAAGAIEELAKAGISTADILSGGLDGALDLAAAGGIQVAEAAEQMASAMTQFNVAGGDATRVADLLAAGAGKAQGGVTEMGQALNQSGLVAAQMGLSIEETVGSLTAFASAGLIGSDAGTSFRAMLLRLANPTKESAQVMSDLGLSFYDAQGQFIGMEGVAGQLSDRMGDLDQETRNAALAQIFGQDAIRTSAILYEQGAQGVADWTAAVDDSGFAAETAATRLDNLKGDFEQLSGALETALIGIGEGGDGPLRTVVSGLADMVTGFTELPAPVQQSVGVLGGVVAVVGLVGGGALIAVPQVVAFRTSLQTLGVTAATTTTALGRAAAFMTGPWGIAIAGAGLALGALMEESREATASAEEWTAALDAGVDAAGMFRLAAEAWGTDWMPSGKTWDGSEFVSNIENVSSYLDLMGERADNAWAALNPANIELDNSGFVASLRQVEDAIASISDAEAMQTAFTDLVSGLDLSRAEAEQLLTVMPDLRDAFLRQADAAGVVVANTDGTIDSQALLEYAFGETEDAAGGAAAGIEGVGEEADSAAGLVQGLVEEQEKLNDLFWESTDITGNYEAAVDDIAAAFAEAAAEGESLAASWDATAQSFDQGDAAGRNAHDTMERLIESGNAHIQMLIDTNAPAEEVRAAQERLAGEVDETAGKFDASGQAAEGYRDRILEIPDRAYTAVELEVARAEARLADFLNRKRVVVVDVDVNGMPSGTIVRPGQVGRFADGGVIPGYAPGYDDRIGFLRDGSVVGLGGGEYIMPTLKTQKYLRELEAMRAGVFPQMGYASGGRIGYVQQAPVVNVMAPAGGAGPQVQLDVHPGPGVSEVAIGQAAASALAWALR